LLISIPPRASAEAAFFNPSPSDPASVANSFPSLFRESTIVMLLDVSILNLFVL